jgi:2'-5' RNA ligase
VRRLFLAIDLPEEHQVAIRFLRVPIPGAKWVPEEQLHLTLRFIGDADDELTGRISASVSGIIAEPFLLALKGVGYFPPKGAPKVLWVGLDSSDALLNLHSDVEKALLRVGLESDIRSFSPHVTIARLKETSAGLLAPFLQKNNRFAPLNFLVTEFVLYSSTLMSQGAIHRSLLHVPLRG